MFSERRTIEAKLTDVKAGVHHAPSVYVCMYVYLGYLENKKAYQTEPNVVLRSATQFLLRITDGLLEMDLSSSLT